jgi:hypothetical protein
MNGLKKLQYFGNLVGKGDLTKFPQLALRGKRQLNQVSQLPSKERDLQLFKYKWVEIHIENVIAQGNVIT